MGETTGDVLTGRWKEGRARVVEGVEGEVGEVTGGIGGRA